MNGQQRAFETCETSIESRQNARHALCELIKLPLILGQELQLGQRIVIVLPRDAHGGRGFRRASLVA